MLLSPRRRRACPAAARPYLERLETRAVPAAFTVTTPADSGPGSLRDAIERANCDAAADSIVVAPEVFGTIWLTTALPDLATDVTIVGPGSPVLSVSRAPGDEIPAFRIFHVTAGASAAISGLQISGGLAETGGGIRNDGTLALSSVDVAGNVAAVPGVPGSNGSGGGIYNAGTLAMSGSIVRINFARGEAGAGDGSGGLGSGGGLENVGTLTLRGTAFRANQAIGGPRSAAAPPGNDGTGGGLSNRGPATISGCTFESNEAHGGDAPSGEGGSGLGGGLANRSALTLTDSSFTGNVAVGGPTNRGGGLYNAGDLKAPSGLGFQRNQVIGYVAARGGGISNSGTMDLVGAGLGQNYATGVRSGPSSGSGYGAGIENDGTMTVGSSILSTNSSTGAYGVPGFGGGVSNSGRMTIGDSRISSNTANFDHSPRLPSGQGFGGGIQNAGQLLVLASTIDSNSAEGFGAANPTTGLPAASGGAGLFSTGELTLQNCTIAGNRAVLGRPVDGPAATAGGGLLNAGRTTILATTFAMNEADIGGAIDNRAPFAPGADPGLAVLSLSNTIVDGVRGGTLRNGGGIYASLGHNLFADVPNVPLGEGDRAGLPLRLGYGLYQSRYLVLLPGSPALDAGSSLPGLTTDQRGVSRLGEFGPPDIGAFESRGFVATVVSGDNQSAPVGGVFAQPLVVQVRSLDDMPIGDGVPFDGAAVGLSGLIPFTTYTGWNSAQVTARPTVPTHAGDYTVTVGGPGFRRSATFHLSVTPATAPVQFALLGTTRIRVGTKGRTRKLKVVEVGFLDPVNAAAAADPANYILLGHARGSPKGTFTKPIPLRAVSYESYRLIASLIPARARLPRGPLGVVVRSNSGLIPGLSGLPLSDAPDVTRQIR